MPIRSVLIAVLLAGVALPAMAQDAPDAPAADVAPAVAVWSAASGDEWLDTWLADVNTYAGRYRGFGTIVILDHGDGWMSLLTHLDTASVAVGDALVQGAPVGKAGAGRPMVTVELRRNGQPVDIGDLVSSG